MNMKNKLSEQLLEFLATGFYSGLVPYAPGTLASLLACIVVLPLIYISLNPFLYMIYKVSTEVSNDVSKKLSKFFRFYGTRKCPKKCQKR